MFLESITKCPARFIYVFFYAVNMWAFVLVNNPILLKFTVLVFWCHEKLLDGVCSLEMYLYALFVAHPLELLSQSLYVGYHHGDVSVFVVVGGDNGVMVVELASLLLLCLCSNWCCSLFRAQVGKGQACNALLK